MKKIMRLLKIALINWKYQRLYNNEAKRIIKEVSARYDAEITGAINHVRAHTRVIIAREIKELLEKE